MFGKRYSACAFREQEVAVVHERRCSQASADIIPCYEYENKVSQNEVSIRPLWR